MKVKICLASLLDGDKIWTQRETESPDWCLIYYNDYCFQRILNICVSKSIDFKALRSLEIKIEDITSAVENNDCLVVFGHGTPKPLKPVVFNRKKNPQAVLLDDSVFYNKPSVLIVNACYSWRIVESMVNEKGFIYLGFIGRALVPVLEAINTVFPDVAERNEIIAAYDAAFLSPFEGVLNNEPPQTIITRCKDNLNSLAEALLKKADQIGNMHLRSHAFALFENADNLTCDGVVS
jgi:hypothetical protein